jgi:hypothetical protein
MPDVLDKSDTLNETWLDDTLECGMTSHLCTIHATHMIVTSCRHNVAACPSGAILQAGRIAKGRATCGHCGKNVRLCWTVVKI